MNPFETPPAPKKPDDKKEEGGWVIGAKKNPDGSWDNAKAVRIIDPEKTAELDTAVDHLDQDKAAKRIEALKIPDFAKPGTALMVSANLKNAIFLNEEAIVKAQKQGKPIDERTKNRLKSLKDQRELLVDLPMSIRMSEDSAVETADYIESHIKGFYERERKRLIDEQSAGTLSSKDEKLGMIEHYDKQLKVAEELQRRLMDEAARKQQR